MPAAPASAEVSESTAASGTATPDNKVSRVHRAGILQPMRTPPLPESAECSGGDTVQLALLAGPPDPEPATESALQSGLPPGPQPQAGPPAPVPLPARPAALPPALKSAAPEPAAPAPNELTPAAVRPAVAAPAALKPARVERPAARPRPASPTRAGSVPTPPARMDRQFIAQNNILERYLTGRLPPRGVQDFERYCRDHPQLLEELRLADHLHAALRLLEAGGHAPPWEQKPQRWWERLPVMIGLCSLCALLAALWLGQSARLSLQQRHNAALEHQLVGQPIDAVEFTRVLRIRPDPRGPSTQSIATIGGDRAELADLQIDLSWSRYHAFNLTIDRVGQGRVAILHNLIRDSNGNLRIELNSSSLGPGDYRLSIDGLRWNGEPVAQAWATITVARHADDP